MELRDFEDEDEYWETGNSSSPKKKVIIPALCLSLIAALLVFRGVFAANIGINSATDVEFGQGVTIATSCDNQVTLTPYASFVNSGSGMGTFKFSSFKLSNINVAACNGVTFTLKAYDSSTANSLTLFSTNSSASVVDTSTTFSVAQNQSGLNLIDTSTSGAFTAQFTSPVAAASNVYKLTLETSGNGNSSVSSVTVSTFTFSSIAAGNGFVCGLTTSSAVWCWGYGANGQLGNGFSQNSSVPVQVQNLGTVTQISVSDGTACALASDGTIKCWGDGGNGTLGNGQDNITSSTPVLVQNISSAISVGVGGSTACAVISGGTIKCWGYNYWGDGGNGTDGGAGVNPVIPYSHIVNPTLVSGITNATFAFGGGCALLSTGSIKCWGYDGNGQLGDGNAGFTGTTMSNVPVSVTGISTATKIGSGYNGGASRCALVAPTGSNLKCWGSNQQGQLGNGNTNNSATPVTANVTNVIDFSTDNRAGDSCVIVSGGSVKCWGWYGPIGMLGTAVNSDSLTPVIINGISGATQITVGDTFACALVSGGKVSCWAQNDYGQFGNGTTNSSATPS